MRRFRRARSSRRVSPMREGSATRGWLCLPSVGGAPGARMATDGDAESRADGAVPEPSRELPGVQAELDRLAHQRQLALDAAHMGWWHYDPATRVATFDERYTEIFGVAGRERPNDEILKLLHPEDLPRVWAAVEAALDPADPKPYSTEYRVIRPDGALRWVEAHGIAVFEGEGAARRATSFVGTVADVTERKRTEALVR